MSADLILVATDDAVVAIDPHRGSVVRAGGLGSGPTCLARDSGTPGRAWCGTRREGVFRSDDAGRSWRPAGLVGEHVMSMAGDAADPGVVWVGTEPSALWGSAEGGEEWDLRHGLEDLPSSTEWAFPPRPDTHHVRWIESHPGRPGHLWLAIEAGALVMTPDGGSSWVDRVPGGPWDTHELAIHAERPDALCVAAGDGYFESRDGGRTWTMPRAGLGVGYLRSVAIDPGDPGTVVVSGASGPRTTYVAGRSDGRLYRSEETGDAARSWERITGGWPNRPDTIAPLLLAGSSAGELWAADERGIHRSDDAGRRWELVERLPSTPDHLRGLISVEGP